MKKNEIKKKKEVEINYTEYFTNKLINAIASLNSIEEELREFSDKLPEVDTKRSVLDHYRKC